MSGPNEKRVRLQYHEGQLQVARDTARFKVLSCGRRWGKTRLAVMESLRVALDGGRVWWLAPTYQMAMEGWRPLMRMCSGDPDAKVNRSDHRVDFGKGSIEVRSADDPDKLRGAGLDLVVLDEAAFMKLDDVWDALRPALTDRQGKAIIISTPKGIDTPFHQMWQTDRVGWKSYTTAWTGAACGVAYAQI